jgi:uncharacterized protein (DUF302 family)
MNEINFKLLVSGEPEAVVTRVTEALKDEGFGVLTRIDLHSKIQEKLGEKIASTVILGACNPPLALAAYRRNSDVASVLPCNVVVREVAAGRQSVEFARPTSLMEVVHDPELADMGRDADERLLRVRDRLSKSAA